MKRHLILIAAALVAGAVSAQTAAPAGHGAHHPQAQAGAGAGAGASASASAGASDFAEGEVRRVDKAAGKITLRHGEIRSLDMPPMTMVFTAASPEMLDRVKAGDKVRFRAANQGGTYTVTEIEAAR